MRKKSKPKTSSQSNLSPVQFRAGGLLDDVLVRFSGSWKVSRNEAAKRLAALAAFDLDERHCHLVETYAERMLGGEDFVRAAHQIRVELQAIDTTRCGLGQQTLTEDERQQEIAQIARAYVTFQRNPVTPEEEKQQVRVYRDS